MRRSLPLADAGALARLAWWTRIGRVSVALLLVAVVAGAALAGRHPSATAAPYLPNGTDGLVVLDLSASISTDTYAEIGSTLSKLASSGGRYGLVLFSSDAYEALPPGTPARELEPYVRFFRVHSPGPGFAPAFPVNPWTQSFSEGTSISHGLDLARTIVTRNQLRKPSLLLISDLDDDPGDLRRVGASALSLRRAHIPVRVVALSASPADQTLFARLFPGRATIEAAPAPRAPAAAPHTRTPVWLVAAALAAAALLAATELLAPVLRLPEAARS
jgi:hypothetical protein